MNEWMDGWMDGCMDGWMRLTSCINEIQIGSRFLTSDWAEKEPEIDESIMKNVRHPSHFPTFNFE